MSKFTKIVSGIAAAGAGLAMLAAPQFDMVRYLGCCKFTNRMAQSACCTLGILSQRGRARLGS